MDHKTTFSWIIVSASIQGVLSGSLYYRPNLFWEHVSATFYLLRLKDNLLEHVRVLTHIGTHLYVCMGICTCGHCFYYFLLLFTCYFQWNTNLTHSDFTCIEIDGRVFFYSERMLCEQALSLLQMCYLIKNLVKEMSSLKSSLLLGFAVLIFGGQYHTTF